MRKVMLDPSILDSDFTEIKKTIKTLEKAEADYIHLDIMDGVFVPNLTFGPKIIAPLRPLTSIPFDAHLMIQKPGSFIDAFAEAGADIITVHYEAARGMKPLIKKIKDRGLKAGISIKPKTSPKVLLPCIASLDLILIMSVEPGFGGQSFMPASLDKARYYRKIIDNKKLNCLLEIDGGINMTTAPLAAAAGIDILVAGSAVFKSNDPVKAIQGLRAAANNPSA